MARLTLDLPEDFRWGRSGYSDGQAGPAVLERLDRRPHVQRWLACWARGDTRDVGP